MKAHLLGLILSVTAALVSLAACSGEAWPTATRTTGVNTVAPSAAPRVTAAGSTTPAQKKSKEPEFGAKFVRIVSKDWHGRERVLTVTAPPDTRFAIGGGLTDHSPLACTKSIVSQGNPMTYHVVCPPAPAGSQLHATTSYGAFDYEIAKAL